MIRAVTDQTDDPAAIEPAPPASGSLTRDDLGRVTRLAAYGLIRRGDEVLLCRISPSYPAAGDWTLPGGGVEFGEPPDVAAIREVEEETGLVARITGAPQILSHTGIWPRREEVRYHHVRFVYPMDVVGGAERVEVGGSTDAFGWFTRDEIRDLPIVGLVSLALDLPIRDGEDEADAQSSSNAEASSA